MNFLRGIIFTMHLKRRVYVTLERASNGIPPSRRELLHRRSRVDRGFDAILIRWLPDIGKIGSPTEGAFKVPRLVVAVINALSAGARAHLEVI